MDQPRSAAPPATITIPQPLPPLGELLRESWRRLIGAIKPLVLLAVISLLPIALVIPLFLLPPLRALPDRVLLGMVVAVGIVQIAAQAIAATGQIYALGTQPVPSFTGALKHGLHRWLAYLGHGLALTAIALGLLAVVALPPLIIAARAAFSDAGIGAAAGGSMIAALALSAALFALVIYFFLRLVFVLPLAALGEGGGTFRVSWQLTRGYTRGLFWRLAVVTLLVMTVAAVGQGIAEVSAVADPLIGAIGGLIITAIIQIAAGLFGTAVLVVLLRRRQGQETAGTKT